MARPDPLRGFRFRIEIDGVQQGGFMSVSGIERETKIEAYREGGVNDYEHQLAVGTVYPPLVLKRGLLVNSEVIDWVRRCLETLPLEPRDVDVKLLNESHEPLMTWHVVGAYPTRWSVSDLQASTSGVVVETLQFYYQRFSVDRS